MLMDLVLSGIDKQRKGSIQCYLDDIILHTFSDHIKSLEAVFIQLRHHNLKLKPTKCKLLYDRLEVLGHIVDADGIHANPAGTAAVQRLPPPKNVKQLQSVIGLCSYFRKYCKGFSKIMQPLYKLLQNDTPFIWGTEQQHALDLIKEILLCPTTLAIFDPRRETLLETDAAATGGFGGCLLQKHGKDFRPVAFLSRSLQKHEKNWTVSELELGSIVWCVKKLKTYLLGIHFTIQTDHHSLCHLLHTKKELTPKLNRMMLELSPFNFEIRYKSGAKHKVPDCLSRLCLPNTEKVNDPEAIDAPVYAINVDEMKQKQSADKDVMQLMKRAQKRGQKYFLIQNGVLYKRNSGAGQKWLPVIPSAMINEILVESHDSPISGHLGFTRTYDKIRKRFYWKNMKKTIYNYVQTCHLCQTKKIPRRKPGGLLNPIAVPDKPFEVIGFDASGPYPRSISQNEYIFTCVCYLTKYIIAKAVRKADAETAAKFLVFEVILRYNTPRKIITDRGSIFTGELFRHLTKYLGITHSLTTSFHAQTNGLCERTHQTLHDCMSMYISLEEQKRWDIVLPHIIYAINTTKHDSSKHSAHYLLFGSEVTLPTEASIQAHESTSIQTLHNNMLRSREIAKVCILKAQEKYTQQYNKKHRQISYNVGERILVYRPVRHLGKSFKLAHNWHGPYVIKTKLNDLNYEIEKTFNGKTTTDVVHVARTKPYYQRKTTRAISPDIASFKPTRIAQAKDVTQQQQPYNLRSRKNQV